MPQVPSATEKNKQQSNARAASPMFMGGAEKKSISD
jgi:hypothetical protein